MKRVIKAAYSLYDIEKALEAGMEPDEYYSKFNGPTSADLDNGAITVEEALVGDVVELGFDTLKIPHGVEAKIIGKRDNGKTIRITYEILDSAGSYNTGDQETCSYYPGEFIGYLIT